MPHIGGCTCKLGHILEQLVHPEQLDQSRMPHIGGCTCKLGHTLEQLVHPKPRIITTPENPLPLIYLSISPFPGHSGQTQFQAKLGHTLGQLGLHLGCMWRACRPRVGCIWTVQKRTPKPRIVTTPENPLASFYRSIYWFPGHSGYLARPLPSKVVRLTDILVHVQLSLKTRSRARPTHAHTVSKTYHTQTRYSLTGSVYTNQRWQPGCPGMHLHAWAHP
jgi:hypothetical protein